jgi:hypothetical protein
MKRALTPALNPTGLGSSAAAIYAAVVMILNATHHRGVIDPQVVVAALGAVAFLYARFKVTPVADPRDGNGVPLRVQGVPAGLPAVTSAGLPAQPDWKPKTLLTPAAPESDQPGAAGPVA